MIRQLYGFERVHLTPGELPLRTTVFLSPIFSLTLTLTATLTQTLLLPQF